MKVAFDEVARWAGERDNVAIALRQLPSGTHLEGNEQTIVLQDTILEGHRFATRPIPAAAPLLSWNLPFAVATQPIAVGQAVMNAKTRQELQSRDLGIELPSAGNFRDQFAPYQLPTDFTPAPPLLVADRGATFQGYRRPDGRGVGTRNVIVLLATNANANGFVTALQARLADEPSAIATLDAVEAVAHTEGATAHANNQELVLRTLAGFMVHPNVAAVLAVDYGDGAVNNLGLEAMMREAGYPLSAVAHHFLTLDPHADFSAELGRGEAIVRDWLPEVATMRRSAESVRHLKIALQCGGSDAFSGISGNPLVGWVAHHLIQQGGGALLAETDELIGAEAYIVANATSHAVAQQFLDMVERFKTWANRFGVSPEGNPSGGNRLRGLYNIALKSLGAAMKKHPATPLSGVVDYGQPFDAPGFHFMDSPGNDLESIAGQVAAGCNLIFFVTGNGSITNFPFVPTLKVVTTSARYQLLANEMDINAGAYLDGTPLAELGEATFAQMVDVASGERTKGELAGHTQVQIWRDWGTGISAERPLSPDALPVYSGEPIPVAISAEPPASAVDLWAPTQRVGLVLPTSLCSGQVARLAVDQLNQRPLPDLDRVVTLVHTEGCGASSNTAEIFDRTMLGYMRHPLVARCLLLEHGCEKTHNGYFRQRLSDGEQVGFASIQQDGGIAKVLNRIDRWFGEAAAQPPAPTERRRPHIGVAAFGEVDSDSAERLTALIHALLAADCTVVVAQHNAVASMLPETVTHEPTLAYGQAATQPGLHLMQMPTTQWGELLTGLGVSAEGLVAFSARQAPQGHPLVPMLRVGVAGAPDVDAVVDEGVEELVAKLGRVLAGDLMPQLQADTFQLARGELGISL